MATSLVRQGRVPIDRVTAVAYVVPTPEPESDGTLEWDATTIVLVEVAAEDTVGVGYTYAHEGAAEIIRRSLADVLVGGDSFASTRHWMAMRRAIRNHGPAGLAAMAVSAVDVALWDLKARLLGAPLVAVLGAARDRVPAYGSGGFTSLDESRLHAQLAAWSEQGLEMVKMKVGRHPEDDPARVGAARAAVGNDVALFVDANGAYSRKEALRLAEAFAEHDVRWFEEPVSSADLDGLRLLCERAPVTMEIAAGEYGYDGAYFERLLAGRAVDVAQADATRCLGITGFLAAAAQCDAHDIDLSAHTAPALHTHLGCAAPRVRHVEYFIDHVRVEDVVFDGAPVPVEGRLRPDVSRPGHGLEVKWPDLDRFARRRPC